MLPGLTPTFLIPSRTKPAEAAGPGGLGLVEPVQRPARVAHAPGVAVVQEQRVGAETGIVDDRTDVLRVAHDEEGGHLHEDVGDAYQGLADEQSVSVLSIGSEMRSIDAACSSRNAGVSLSPVVDTATSSPVPIRSAGSS